LCANPHIDVVPLSDSTAEEVRILEAVKRAVKEIRPFATITKASKIRERVNARDGDSVARQRLPKELYRLVPALYPHLAEILVRSGLTGTVFFALSHVRHSGKELPDGMVGLPIADLKNILLKVGEYESTSGAHGFITNHLENSLKYLEHRTITPEEKKALFPESPGYRDVVVITPAGAGKLDEVNAKVDQLFQEVTGGLRGRVVTGLMKAFTPVAATVIDKLESMSMNREES